jgi:hypothetical protein
MEAIMNAQQKDAVYCLVLSSATLAVFLILLKLLGDQVAFSAFALFGLYGLAPWIFYRKSKEKTIVDERDIEIRKRAGTLALSLFWISFVLVAVLVPLIKGFQTLIPVSLFFYLLMFGAILICVGRSVTILFLYRQRRAE